MRRSRRNCTRPPTGAQPRPPRLSRVIHRRGRGAADRQARRAQLPRCRRRVRRAFGGKGAAPRVGHAGTLDPFATGLLLVLVGTRDQSPAGADGPAQALRDRRPPRRDVEHRRHRGRDRQTGRDPARPAAAADRRDAPAPADALGWEGRRRARVHARATRGELREARADRDGARFEQLWRESGERDGPQAAGYEIDCGSGTYVRSLITDLGDAYCLELRRTAIGPFEVADAARHRRATAGDRSMARSPSRR